VADECMQRFDLSSATPCRPQAMQMLTMHPRNVPIIAKQNLFHNPGRLANNLAQLRPKFQLEFHGCTA